MVKLKINQQNQREDGQKPNKCLEQDPIRLINAIILVENPSTS